MPETSSPTPIPQAALNALAELYADLDARVRQLGVQCRACGACCHFQRSGYRLYAAWLERAALVRAHGRPRLAASGECGFLAEGRCRARAWRPLGCRVFFCDPAHKPREQGLYHEFLARLRAIADRFALPWDYAPLFPGGTPAGQNSALP